MDSSSADDLPQASHLLLVPFFAIFFAATRFFFDSLVFRRLARWLLGKGNAKIKLNKIAQAKVAKCSESIWKLTYFLTVEICILCITYHESWFTNTNQYFQGWPNQQLKVSLKLYYTGQCGFYLYSVVALQVWETPRKDFAVTMAHHVITVILIGYSYITGIFRIGSVTLALHDANDVFLEAAKIFKYSDHDLAASLCFGLFAISWFFLRLIIFPFWVIRASSFDFCNHLDLSKTYHIFMYYVFNTLLLTLLVFHIYWWILICSMIRRQLKNKGKVGEDIRSDSDNDE